MGKKKKVKIFVHLFLLVVWTEHLVKSSITGKWKNVILFIILIHLLFANCLKRIVLFLVVWCDNSNVALSTIGLVALMQSDESQMKESAWTIWIPNSSWQNVMQWNLLIYVVFAKFSAFWTLWTDYAGHYLLPSLEPITSSSTSA